MNHETILLAALIFYLLIGPLSHHWAAYRRRLPGSRRALALALYRTVPGTMRAFPGVGEA